MQPEPEGRRDEPQTKSLLNPSECRFLDSCLRDYEEGLYQSLRDPQRMFLVELACSPTSVLTEEARKKGLKAERLSIWNGYDLASNDGVTKALKFIEQEAPEHLWISTECTPFSPMQNVNQRNPKQVQDLETKRTEARHQHTGALIVAWYAYARGTQVSWEWSRRCRAWKWKPLEEWRAICRTQTSIISACQVNLRNSRTGAPLGKEWRVESTSASFGHAIHLPCPSKECKSKHGPSEGSDLRGTAFYSPEFARRVVYHMRRDGDGLPKQSTVATQQQELIELQDMHLNSCQCHRWKSSGPHLLCSKCLGFTVGRDPGRACSGSSAGPLQGSSDEASGWGTSEASGSGSRDQGTDNAEQGSKGQSSWSKEQIERVKRQLHHLHRASGHGSYESLIRGLEHRKAAPEVLKLAREFRCSVCEERKRPAPRRLANLEVCTEKCKIVQMDSAWWAPPNQDGRNKCQFVVFVDEASRFAVARLFRKDGGGHLTASDILKGYHELWEPCFGVPEIRADLDGACRSRELDAKLQEQRTSQRMRTGR